MYTNKQTDTTQANTDRGEKNPLGNDENLIRLAEKSIESVKKIKIKLDRLDAVFVPFDIPLNANLMGYVYFYLFIFSNKSIIGFDEHI